MRLIAPWFALLVVITSARIGHALWTGDVDQTSNAQVALGFVELLAAIVLPIVAAVKWHRYILIGEMTPALSPGPASTVLRYGGLAILILLATLLPIVLVELGFMKLGTGLLDDLIKGVTAAPAAAQGGLLEQLEQDPESAEIWGGMLLLALPFAALILYLPCRVSLALPEVALGLRGGLLRRAWRLSRGNFWRLFWASVLTSIAMLVVAVPELLLGNLTRSASAMRPPKRDRPWRRSSRRCCGSAFCRILMWR